jgi:hypothetical protein
LISVVAPVYADDVYDGASSLGLIVGALGGGALVGNLLFAAFHHPYAYAEG